MVNFIKNTITRFRNRYREWYKKLIAKGLTDEDVAEMMHKNESFMKRIREGRKEDQNDEDRVDSIC